MANAPQLQQQTLLLTSIPGCEDGCLHFMFDRSAGTDDNPGACAGRMGNMSITCKFDSHRAVFSVVATQHGHTHQHAAASVWCQVGFMC
eukprot:scaffold40331_cov29-Tisochrysis_lutea.AAC.2